MGSLPALIINPTLNQIRIHERETSKALKILSIIYSAVLESIFTKIINYETVETAYDMLMEYYQENKRTKKMNFWYEGKKKQFNNITTT